MNSVFCDLLLKWDKKSNDRPMPWKGEKDPYKIWLSEIILQQTRVEQGWAYYERFVKKYPSLRKLAAANDNEVFKLWEGLGYYNRCKNLLFTARHIANNLDGKFPDSYEALLSLKGVGPYTAAAIASFAYNLPHAVVDGNVFRVFARYFGIHTPTDTKNGLAMFNKIALENLAKSKAGIYNQALMDFGATVCKPMSPLCSSCVMQSTCKAFAQNEVGQLPVKLKVIQKKKRYFDYFCFKVEDRWWLQQRGVGDIWANLHQFYLIEQEKVMPASTSYFTELVCNQLLVKPNSFSISFPDKLYTQQLTHQLLQVRFVVVNFNKIPKALEKGTWVKTNDLKQFAFPKTIKLFLEEQAY